MMNSGNDSLISVGWETTESGENEDTFRNLPGWCEVNSLEWVIRGILLTGISIFGIFGNVLCGLTFARMRRNTSFAYFLLGLTCCDLVFVLCSLILFGIHALFAESLCGIYPFVLIIFYPIVNIAQTASVYLIVIVTLERYFAVCQPLKSQSSHLTSGKRALWIILWIILFSVLFNVPRFMEYVVIWHDEFEPYGYQLVPSTLRENDEFKGIYLNYSYTVVMFAVPNVVLLIFNSLIYREVLKADKARKNLSRSQQSENSLALMLMCVVVVFLLCNLLPFVNNVMEYNFQMVFSLCVYLGDFLATLNSSVNFLIYYVFGKKFRKYFKQTYFTWRKRQMKDAPKLELNVVHSSSHSATPPSTPGEGPDLGAKRGSNTSVLTSETDLDLNGCA